MIQGLKEQYPMSKSWFFETVSEIDKLLAKLAKMKRGKTHINQTR